MDFINKTLVLNHFYCFYYARAEFAQLAINHLNGMKLVNCQYLLRMRIADDYLQQRTNLFYDMSHGDPRGMF